MNVLHEFVDDLLRVDPAPFVHSPAFVLLQGPEYPRVGGARAGVSVVLGVLCRLVAGLTAVAHRGLALGGGVAGVPGVAGVVRGDVLQGESMFRIKRWHAGRQTGESLQLAVQLGAPGGLLPGQEYGLVPSQRPEVEILLSTM